MLIGGLGMGFTLRAALGELGRRRGNHRRRAGAGGRRLGARSDGALFGDSLDDPRVTVREADVGQLIRPGAAGFDAILLDVDNGPEGLTAQGQ